MDAFIWPLVSLVSGLVGAGLTYLLGRRTETLAALREARTVWALQATAYREAAVRTSVTEGKVGDLNALDRSADLIVLDPVGSAAVHAMVRIHTSAEVRISSEWGGGTTVVRTVLPPQMERLGRYLEHTIALWAQVNWLMPIWRVRFRCRKLLYRERLWTYFMHGELIRKFQRKQRRRNARSFREYARQVKADFKTSGVGRGDTPARWRV